MSFVNEHFKMLCEIGECIAKQFGDDCEVVLHDLTRSYDNTIVAIWNGHVTGRNVGDGGTDAGLAILRGTAQPKDEYCYINRTKEGRILRSSSKYFLDEQGNAVGSLCINYDITALVAGQSAMMKLTSPDREENTREVFTSNIDELLEILMKEAVESTGHTLDTLDKEDKVAVVRYLDNKGAFLIKKSAERVADFLGISRFTVYNYLNEAQEEA
ncbi:transcriptional regulator [Mediterraneibacter sp. NSJ-55]|uniref:Transcriptional regulator n=1 Tax=Mediterraneibacter hominis TaxID=2763054 RepID=A0A923LKD3_9FIRM|nr:helix-turn-helix transcriptional regulator [Mediterraneibacter hominis]MBC5690463.1 transcriptional regulator [Mediterraneibacter hominis]